MFTLLFVMTLRVYDNFTFRCTDVMCHLVQLQQFSQAAPLSRPMLYPHVKQTTAIFGDLGGYIHLWKRYASNITRRYPLSAYIIDSKANDLYTGWSKKTVPPFYFCDNFRKCASILTIFHWQNKRFITHKSKITPATSPLLCNYPTQ